MRKWRIPYSVFCISVPSVLVKRHELTVVPSVSVRTACEVGGITKRSKHRLSADERA